MLQVDARMNQWTFLIIAILSEIVATSFLKASNGFTHLWPSVVAVLGYVVAFYFLSLTLKTMPVGVAYALWSGIGIAFITLIAWVLFDQKLDLAALIGIVMIVSGVIVINVFSKSAGH